MAGQDEDSLLLMKTLLTKRNSWAFYYIAGHQGLNYYFPEAAFIGTDTTNDTLVLYLLDVSCNVSPVNTYYFGHFRG